MISDEQKFNQELGNLIRRARLSQGLSQKDIAKRIGVSSQQFQKYETGENGISLYKLNMLCIILDISF